MMFKSVLNKIITVVCAACIATTTFIYSAVSASAEDFDSPFVKYDNVVISYTLVDFEPSESYPVVAFDAINYFCTYTEIDFFTMIGAYSFYKANQGNYIVAEYKNSDVDDGYGYIFWRDDTGAYQHLMWKVADEDDSSASFLSSDVLDSSYDYATVSGSDFADMAQMYKDHYGPKTAKEYISWRTDSRFSSVSDSGLSAPRLSFFTDGYFCGETDWQEVYLVPWYTDGITDYFGQYQFHFYQVVTKDDSGTRIITLYCDVWDMLNGGDVQTVTISNQLMDYRYIDFCVSTEASRLMMTLYPSYTKYIQRTRSTVLTPAFTMTDNIGKNIVYSSDLSVTEDINAYLACWRKAVTTHDEGDCTVAAAHDTGYYCSDKQIYMNFDFIDTSKLTEDDVVTLSGDTFYDYTITNSTTGDSTTVYNYITNNYNYPVSEDSDSSGEDDSGSASGDVNVSGNIDVGGSVDVNINVNQSSSGDGNTSAYEYESVNLDEALEQIPEMGDGFIGFFSRVFDWLPAPIFGLIVGGLGLAIVLRIAGR